MKTLFSPLFLVCNGVTKTSKNNFYLSGIKPNMAFYISMSLTYFRPKMGG